MKLSEDLINFIESVVNTGLSINIENIIIEEGAVRAIDEDRTVVLYQNTNIPELPFNSIGLSRIHLFSSRLGLIKGRAGFAIDASLENESSALHLKMESDDTKISYRCTDPETIQAPKQINDNIIYRVQLNAEAVNMLQRGSVAMSADTVSITGNDSGVSFELTDVTNDTFSHTFTSEVVQLETDSNSEFAHNYPIKIILALFKQNPDGTFEIGSKGILCISIKGINVYVLPQV